MNSKTKIGMAVIVVLAAAGARAAVYAQPSDPAPPEPMPPMATPDVDGDRPGMVDAEDSNTTGNVTVEEVTRTPGVDDG